ncbi:MAG: GGDEF domain-containing protein [Deltaproteobacteria bacterium]|nr:GGDEF domain-containing protein [Deltaproteobacteria bacterium]
MRSSLPADVGSYIAELEATQRLLRREIDRLSIFRHLAFRDDLTGLYNRRYFEERLAQEWSRATRFEVPLALVVIDLDGFKLVNDVAGHAAGDLVLAFVGRHMIEECRGFDIPCRLGGDEFAYLLPETDLVGARALAERLAARLDSATDRPALPAGVTFGLSFGAATRLEVVSPTQLVERADAEMYARKRDRKSEAAPPSGIVAA